MKPTTGERAFRAINVFIMGVSALLMTYPFWYLFVTSVTHPAQIGASYLWPQKFFYLNYWFVLTEPGLPRAYFISVLRVATGVPLMLLITGGAAFALTRKNLVGRTPIIIFFFITMFFSGGLIPFYLVLKTFRLLNTFWVYIIPTAFSVWTMIVMKTSIQSLPDGMVEAAVVDGAGYTRIFATIILPLSLPMLATLGLFSAVSHWNEWFTGVFYVTSPKLRPLQSFLRTALEALPVDMADYAVWYQKRFGRIDDIDRFFELKQMTPRSIELTYVMLSTIPILLVYPWVQKYFVKGVLIGSIKG